MNADEIEKVTAEVENKLSEILLWTVLIACVTLILVIFGAEKLSLTTTNKMMVVGLTICIELLSFYYIVKALLNKHLTNNTPSTVQNDVARWAFNPKGKQRLTMGEQVKGALYVTNRKQAELYLKAYVEYMQRQYTYRRSLMEMEREAKDNIINYYTISGDEEILKRVIKLFS